MKDSSSAGGTSGYGFTIADWEAAGGYVETYTSGKGRRLKRYVDKDGNKYGKWPLAVRVLGMSWVGLMTVWCASHTDIVRLFCVIFCCGTIVDVLALFSSLSFVHCLSWYRNLRL